MDIYNFIRNFNRFLHLWLTIRVIIRDFNGLCTIVYVILLFYTYSYTSNSIFLYYRFTYKYTSVYTSKLFL